MRLRMVRYCATWLLAPFLLFLASAWWYVQALPEPQRAWIVTFSPELAPFLTVFLWASPLLFLGGLIMVIRLPRTATRSLAVILLLLGITYMGAFEYIREGSRRPFTLFGHLYANSILAKDLDAVQAQGILASAKWVTKEITEENRLVVGRQLLQHHVLLLPFRRRPHSGYPKIERQIRVRLRDGERDKRPGQADPLHAAFPRQRAGTPRPGHLYD